MKFNLGQPFKRDKRVLFCHEAHLCNWTFPTWIRNIWKHCFQSDEVRFFWGENCSFFYFYIQQIYILSHQPKCVLIWLKCRTKNGHFIDRTRITRFFSPNFPSSHFSFKFFSYQTDAIFIIADAECMCWPWINFQPYKNLDINRQNAG